MGRRIHIKTKQDSNFTSSPMFMGVELNDLAIICGILTFFSMLVRNLSGQVQYIALIITGVTLYVLTVLRNIYLPKAYFYMLARKALGLEKSKMSLRIDSDEDR